MKKIGEFISILFRSVGTGIYWSLYVLMAGLPMILALWFAPIFALVVTICIVPFHWSDLKKMLTNRDWTIIAGRLLFLFVLGSFVAGVALVALGIVYSTKTFLFWCSSIIFLISFSIFTAYVFCDLYFPNLSFIKNIKSSIKGLFSIGIFWRYQ
jgi:hypothetical protein